jgi:hypothetical protein
MVRDALARRLLENAADPTAATVALRETPAPIPSDVEVETLSCSLDRAAVTEPGVPAPLVVNRLKVGTHILG